MSVVATIAEPLIHNTLLSLATVLCVAIILGELFERIKLDSVIGYLIAGLILGPSFLNLVSAHTIEEFATIGAIMILFLAGLKEQNIKAVYSNKKAVLLGVGVLAISFLGIFSFISSPAMNFITGQTYTIIQCLFLALAYSVVDLGVPAKLLLSKKLINTDFGQIILNSAVLNVILGLLVLTIMTFAFAPSLLGVVTKFIQMLAFILIFLGLFWLMGKVGKYLILLESEEIQFTATFVVILFLAYFTEMLGFSNILGAFLAGVILSKVSYSETRAFMDRFNAVSMGLFVPLFFGWFGLELQLWGSNGIIANIPTALVFFVLSTVLKFSVTYIISKYKKIAAPGLVASSMLSLDVESLIILIISIKIGVFVTKEPLSVFAPSVLFTTIIVTILVNIFSKIEKKEIDAEKNEETLF